MIVKLAFAFGAGFISFLTPCVLPIIPGYISYITGKNLNEIEQDKKNVLIKTILFALGFSFVFISFGATASFLGSVILNNSYELRKESGIIIIIFSLHILGIINLNFLNYEKRIYTDKKSGIFSSILVGMAFGFGWTPCIGPILGSILALASTEQSLNRGIFLLVFYSLGLAIPFVLSGYLIQKFLVFSKNIKSKMNIILKSGGVLLLITGLLIITNQLQAIGFYLLKYIPILQKIG